MNFQQFEGSLFINLEFKKANISSRVLKIDTDGIRYSIGQNSKQRLMKSIVMDVSQENGTTRLSQNKRKRLAVILRQSVDYYSIFHMLNIARVHTPMSNMIINSINCIK
jgi:hypothetical protein